MSSVFGLFFGSLHRHAERADVADALAQRGGAHGTMGVRQGLAAQHRLHLRLHQVAGTRIDAADDDAVGVEQIHQDRQTAPEVVAHLPPDGKGGFVPAAGRFGQRTGGDTGQRLVAGTVGRGGTALQLFTGNSDTLNVKRYRNPKADGKWRWVLFDLDWAFYVDTNSIRRWLEPGGMGTNLYTDNSLFIACMKNPIFREQFLTYFGEQMATTFTTESMLARFNERYALIDGLLVAYREQWGLGDMVSSMKKLYSYCETRPTKLLGYFQETFNFSEAEFNRYFGAAVEEIKKYESKEAAA